MSEITKKTSHDLRFVKGGSHLLVGPSSCGKSYRVRDILRSKSEIIEGGDKIKNVVICYAAWQPVYQQLKDEGIATKFVNKKPSAQEFVDLVKEYKNSGGSICVLDDFMTEIDSDLVEIICVQSRHNLCSTFLLFQSLFPANKLARQISLNVKYMHCFKNPRENAQIKTLARQISPSDSSWIVDMFQAVTSKPYQCLLIDLTQQCDEKLRFRSNYLPHELPMCVYLKAGTIVTV